MPSVTRRDFVRTCVGTASTVALGCTPIREDEMPQQEQGNKPGRKPNIVFVFPDQMRAHAQGFMNEDPVKTPVLDRFADESVVFTQAVSNFPICSPFRAMLFTGQYPQSNGVLENCNSRSAPFGNELRQTARCWSDLLKADGYDLGYLGKWHLDVPFEPYVDCPYNKGKIAWNEWCPPERRHGFDYWYAYGTFDHHMRPMYWSTDATRHEHHRVDRWGPEHEADKAVAYIRNDGGALRDNDKPFALVVAMNPPHTPYDAYPKRYAEAYAGRDVEELCNRGDIPAAGTKWGDYYRKHIRNYLAMVTGVDDQFGRILTALREQGLEDDTIVVFTSDHGNCLGIHDCVSKNNHYEESLRIPLMIRWPGRIAARRDDLLVSVPDFYPTLMELMGLGEEIPKEVEGVSHAPLLLTGEGARPTSQLYLKCLAGQPKWGRRGVRTERHTLMINKMPDQPVEYVLHDNIEDRFQLKNIADAQKEVVDRLVNEELNPWLRKTRDPWLS